ncbi:MAG: hypothetical protein LQ350_000254 [Teloschistes chrysophthalmus]|nr:MAG: hypothetical protein LQ350_000254 [Niorma chrysophthalma]
MSSESLPPLQPSFVLRGHSAQVHAVHFLKDNTRLLTADAEGWLVSWSLASKRPVAVWKAHDDAILGIGSWGQDRIITHGRDSKLAVWQLGPDQEASIGKTLPVNKPPITTPHPWLLHMLTVNTLNFCQFAMCLDDMPQPSTPHAAIKASKHPPPILVAVPNTMDSGGKIDIYQLPSGDRAAVIHADRDITTGMVMALNIQAESARIQVIAGYESGHTMVFVQSDPCAPFQRLYAAHSHSQPILSMAILPSRDGFLSSSADAVIAKHPLPVMPGVWKTELKPFKVIKTKHSGQQGLDVRSDSKIFATAGWDARVRVYSCKTLKELAVLKWHKVGCYATAFAEIAECCPVKTEPKLQTKQEEVPIKREVDEEVPIIKQEEEEAKYQDESALTNQASAVTTVQQRREAKAQSTHWLAAASKDGKVSLWDIY